MICRYCYTGADESQEHLGSCTGTNKEKRAITDMGKNTILEKTLCKARGKREIGKKDHGGIMLGNLATRLPQNLCSQEKYLVELPLL